MRPFALIHALLALSGLAIGHEAEDSTGYQEPFVGWTKEDLDAKWGTDVSH